MGLRAWAFGLWGYPDIAYYFPLDLYIPYIPLETLSPPAHGEAQALLPMDREPRREEVGQDLGTSENNIHLGGSP